ncbi:beta strand repeat-containing protein [Streptomyces sp. NPDC001635]
MVVIATVVACPVSASAVGTESQLQAAVGSEAQLLAAISSAVGPTSIPLDNDITLSDTLTIPSGKDVTLTGDHDLIGAVARDTVTVAGAGKLTLGGITVTHASGQTGSGVVVQSGGELVLASGAVSGNVALPANFGSGVRNFGTVTMSGGSISDNTAASGRNGAGVYNSGSFDMTGGSISGNTAGAAGTSGGGVFNDAGGTFDMSGGGITGNAAPAGGGVSSLGTLRLSDAAGITGNTAANGAGVFNFAAFTMTGGAISDNTATATGGGVRNNGADATFTMSGGEISGNTATGDTGGGVFNFTSATFTLAGGKVWGNTASATAGGGVTNQRGATFKMTSGEIAGNTSTSGGGVLNWSDTAAATAFTMSGGTISGNVTTAAASRGGGVFNISSSTGTAAFTMSGGVIRDERASNGGAVYNTGAEAVTTVNGGSISGNTAEVDGGGIYNTSGAVTDIQAGSITENTAGVDGGGVWTDDYTKLTVEAGVIFSGNRASAAYHRNPADDAVYAAHIHGIQWSFGLTQGYNNFDINHRFGEPINYAVTYNGNGNTSGSAPVDATSYQPGDTVTVLGKGNLERTGYRFLGWSTDPNATSAQYQPGDTFTITGNTTLSAVWEAVPATSVTVDKRVESRGPFKVGDTVRYTYTVTNTGNTELSNVGVTDNLVKRVTCGRTTLTPGQSTTCRGSYTITPAAVRKCPTPAKRYGGTSDGRCRITNTARAWGMDENGDRVTSRSARATITVTMQQKPSHHRANSPRTTAATSTTATAWGGTENPIA